MLITVHGPQRALLSDRTFLRRRRMRKHRMLPQPTFRVRVICFRQPVKRLQEILPFFIRDHAVRINVQPSYYRSDFSLRRRPAIHPDKTKQIVDTQGPVPARIHAFECFATVPVRSP